MLSNYFYIFSVYATFVYALLAPLLITKIATNIREDKEYFWPAFALSIGGVLFWWTAIGR